MAMVHVYVMTTEQEDIQGQDYYQGCGVSGDSCTFVTASPSVTCWGPFKISATVIYLVIFSSRG